VYRFLFGVEINKKGIMTVSILSFRR